MANLDEGVDANPEGVNVHEIAAPATVAIIGCGAAGIAAAWRLLSESDVTVRLFEALDRRGGRAHTEDFGGVPLDLGCHWQHGDEWAEGIRNHLPQAAQNAIDASADLQARLRHRPQQQQMRFAFPRDLLLRMEALDQPDPFDAVGALEEAMAEVAGGGEQANDVAASDVEQGCDAEEYTGAPAHNRAFARALVGELEEGAALDAFSVVDQRFGDAAVADLVAQAEFQGDGDQALEDADDDEQPAAAAHFNNVSERGFGALITAVCQALEAGFPDRFTVVTGRRVETVRHGDGAPDGRVELALDNDQTFGCDHVIVTASTAALAAGYIAFEPALPQALTTAFGRLPLGHYKKIALRFDRDVFADTRDVAGEAAVHAADHYAREQSVYLMAREAAGVWRFLTRVRGANIVVAIVGGALAQELDGLADDAVRGRMLDALTHTIGRDVAAHLAGDDTIRTSRWSQIDSIRGAYSTTRVGGAGARVLIRDANPSGRVRFAGEALWSEGYGTAHAALLSGRLAAHRIMAALADDDGADDDEIDEVD